MRTQTEIEELAARVEDKREASFAADVIADTLLWVTGEETNPVDLHVGEV